MSTAFDAYRDAQAQIDILYTTSAALGVDRAHEMELEDDRALVKMEAVKRIMARDGLAATPAEKIVETDEAYMLHRQRQREAVIQCQCAWGAFKAAEFLAQLSVEAYKTHAATEQAVLTIGAV